MSDRKPFANIFVSTFVLAALVMVFTQEGRAGLYPTTSPPQHATDFNLSGPFTVCDFFRPDRPEPIGVEISCEHCDNNTTSNSTEEVKLTGLAVCGIPSKDGQLQKLQDFAFFDVNVTFGCVNRTVSGNTVKYKQRITDSCGHLVSGSFTANTSFTPVGNIDQLLSYCPQGDLAHCVLNVGVDGISTEFFQTSVCPAAAGAPELTDNGQIFAFMETIVNGKTRPGMIRACYCHSEFGSPNVTCGTKTAPEHITTRTSAASRCTFDWQQNNDKKSTINLGGSPNQVSAAIYDSPECPVVDIDTKTVNVCNGVTPGQFKIEEVNGKLALTFQVAEDDCVASMQDLTPRQSRPIYATGAFKDQTRFKGSDEVTVVASPTK